MPYIPHTKQDVEEMLKTIGVDKIENLFDEIPASLRLKALEGIPSGISEIELGQLIRERARKDGDLLCFIGAGAYEHYIPAAVWDIATRGEFMTAYTPYQAEASQGSLQLIYEYQTMMANLMAMEVSNASLYDGASALSEAILMAVRLANKNNKNQILMPRNIHPFYLQTAKAILSQQDITLIDVPYEKDTGKIDFSALENCYHDQVAALVIPQPNFFGALEEVDDLVAFAKAKNILSIAVVNPTAMALLKPPGEWGKTGVDIACGDGQPLGIPLNNGGPYYGFLCCKKSHVRQMPGRIVGRTIDMNGKPGFVLTLQAREQHIRRAKATSNICTNQGLMVTASTIYMSLLGPNGLRHVASLSHQKTRQLMSQLTTLKGVEPLFTSPYFHEIALRVDYPIDELLKALSKRGIQGGCALKEWYPELANGLLISVTETKTDEEIQHFVRAMHEVLAGRRLACLA